jgi:glucose/arabinose dehydrogenase
VTRSKGAWPKAPAGFQVQQYATGLDNPRLMRTAPNGDIFLAESSSGIIRVFRGITPEGNHQQRTNPRQQNWRSFSAATGKGCCRWSI